MRVFNSYHGVRTDFIGFNAKLQRELLHKNSMYTTNKTTKSWNNTK